MVAWQQVNMATHTKPVNMARGLAVYCTMGFISSTCAVSVLVLVHCKECTSVVVGDSVGVCECG